MTDLRKGCKTMEKLTDAEVIKVLEHCAEENDKTCGGCPLRKYLGACIEIKSVLALDLIKRKDAEIESWKEQNMRLDKECNHFIRFASAAKSEAYKEFAEKLFENTCVYEFENKAEGYTEGVVDTMDFYIGKINDTLQELTEGKREDSN